MSLNASAPSMKNCASDVDPSRLLPPKYSALVPRTTSPSFGSEMIAFGPFPSSSTSSTATRCDARPDDEQVRAALCVTASPSCAAVTVIFCAVFQLEGVNVRLAGENAIVDDPIVRATVTVTLALGCVASFTVNEPLVPSGTCTRLVDATMACCAVPEDVILQISPAVWET